MSSHACNHRGCLHECVRRFDSADHTRTCILRLCLTVALGLLLCLPLTACSDSGTPADADKDTQASRVQSDRNDEVAALTDAAAATLNGCTFIGPDLSEGSEQDYGWDGSVSFDTASNAYSTSGGTSGYWACYRSSTVTGTDETIYFLYFGVGGTEVDLRSADDATAAYEYFHQTGWFAQYYPDQKRLVADHLYTRP